MSLEFSIQNKFESWLDENNWFQEGYCLGFKVSEERNKVTLTLAYQIKGTYEANSERVRRVFEITAIDISEMSEVESSDFNSDHCMEGVDLLECSNGIGFSVDIPKILNIKCKKVILTKKDDLIDSVKPWVSDNEIFVQVSDGDGIPSAEKWVSWFKQDGVEISWRYYGGEARDSSSIPHGNYEGWYLQELEEIPNTKEGLFFQHLNKEGDNLGFHARRNEFNDRLWLLFMKYFLKIEELKISCGNCKFNHQDWENHLSDVQKNG